MPECIAEQSYPLNDVQKQRLSLEVALGGPAMSWIVAGAVVHGVSDLKKFHRVLLELPRAYPVLRTALVTAGPTESWHQHIRSCQDLWRSGPPVVALPRAGSWADLFGAMRPYLDARNPDFRYAAAYGLDDAGRLRVALSFDHMAFDIKSIEIVLAYLARAASGEEIPENDQACRCGSNEFASYVQRTLAVADGRALPERYEWALELMRAARSPHAYARIPLARPLSVADGGPAAGIRSRFVTDPRKRHSYTPFAAFVTALALSLEASFESPAIFYAPSLNRQPAELQSVGWFAGTPILPVRSREIMPAVEGERIVDGPRATSEVKAATTETMRDGQLLTDLIYHRLSGLLGGRSPFLDCREDSLPYIVLGYADRVRDRTEWKAGDVTIRKAVLPGAVLPSTGVPPGYTYFRLIRAKKAEWTLDAIYEKERYENGSIEILASSTERYLRQLLG